jgi:hypothetical protein
MAVYQLVESTSNQKSCTYEIALFLKEHQLIVGVLLALFGVLCFGLFMLNNSRPFIVDQTQALNHPTSAFDAISPSHNVNLTLFILSATSLIAGLIISFLSLARKPK